MICHQELLSEALTVNIDFEMPIIQKNVTQDKKKNMRQYE